MYMKENKFSWSIKFPLLIRLAEILCRLIKNLPESLVKVDIQISTLISSLEEEKNEKLKAYDNYELWCTSYTCNIELM